MMRNEPRGTRIIPARIPIEEIEE